MKIGLTVITYNRLMFTQQCLKSIEWSTPSNTTIVIVDNNSTDGTVEFLKSYSSPLLKKIIFNDKNKGVGSAWLTGWNVLKDDSDILGKIDNDFLFEPGWESNILACFEDLDIDYLVGTVWDCLPGSEGSKLEKKITSSGNGFYIPPWDGAAHFLLSRQFKNRIAPSSSTCWPGQGFHFLIQKLKGVGLAPPGILVRDQEYSRPEYVGYYDEIFGKRSFTWRLVQYRQAAEKGKQRNWPNWNQFLKKYYPDKEE